MENEFPPNSHSRKEVRPVRPSEAPAEKKHISKVTTGKVTIRKKPLSRRFVEAFTGDANKGVGEYVLLDVVIPGIKDIVADASITTIERSLFGDDTPSRRPRKSHGGGGFTSYNRMGPSNRGSSRDRDRAPRRDTRRSADIPEVVLETRVEADMVLSDLFELLSKYDVVTMRDFLSLVGENHNFMDEDWGWTDLRGSRVHRIRGGYLIDMPRPVPLD